MRRRYQIWRAQEKGRDRRSAPQATSAREKRETYEEVVGAIGVVEEESTGVEEAAMDDDWKGGTGADEEKAGTLDWLEKRRR